MSTTLKIAAASGVLAAGLVFSALPSGASVPTKSPFTEPVPSGPVWEGTQPAASHCAKATWPYVPQDCGVVAATRAVRTIAIERGAAR